MAMWHPRLLCTHGGRTRPRPQGAHGLEMRIIHISPPEGLGQQVTPRQVAMLGCHSWGRGQCYWPPVGGGFGLEWQWCLVWGFEGQ